MPVDAGATPPPRPHFSPEVEKYRTQAEQDLGNPADVDAYLKSLEGGNEPAPNERERQRRLRIQSQQQADTQAVLATQTAPLSLAEKLQRTASPLSAYGTIADALTPAPVGSALEAIKNQTGEGIGTFLSGVTPPSIGPGGTPVRNPTAMAAGQEVAGAVVPQTLPDLALTVAPFAGKATEAATTAASAGRSILEKRALEGLGPEVSRAPGVAGQEAQAVARRAESLPVVAGAADVPEAAKAAEAVAPAFEQATKTVPPGIEAALNAKAEATQTPGRIFGPEGSLRRKVVGALNPSVDMPQDIHVANQARVAVTSAQRTEWASQEVPAYKKLATVFEDTKPAYVGPEGRPAANTWIDYAENPRFYQASPELTAAKEDLRAVQDAVIGKAQSDFGVDVKPYQSPVDPEAVYVPHMQSQESIDNAIQRTEASLSSNRSISKERAYDSLSDRMAKNPDFKPETDPVVLADVHSGSLASMSGANTFKQGVGGKTLTEVIDEVHPGLRESKDKLAQAVQNARARIDTAETRALANDSTLAPLIKEQNAITERAVPRYVSLAEADRITPELRDMQTQLRELRVRATSLDNAIAKVQGRKAANALRLKQDIQELDNLKPQLEQLRANYHAAAPGDYVQGKDYRYHLPERAQAIESVLKTGFNNAFIDGAIEAGNSARAIGMGPDFSPLTIQGGLGALSHPEVGIQNAAGLVKAAFSNPETMIKDLGPDVVKRFEFATNRRLGSLSEEVVGNRGLRLPGQPVKKFNDALQRVVDYGSVKAWENDSNLLMKLGMESQNMADHEAANNLSKIIPRMNNYETGRSIQRVKLEGVLPTSRSFTAQPLSLAKDYASALVKIPLKQELLGREKLALIRATTLIGTLTTISVASALAFAEANGKNPVEAVKEVTDPSSGKFLHLIISNKGSVPLGGPLRSAFLGVFRTATTGPEGLYNYAKGRLQPELGAAVESATNRDFQGNPVRSGSAWDQALQTVEHQARAFNLITGGTIQGIEQGGLTGGLTQAASQIAGQNYTERSPTDTRDALAVKLTGKHYNELPPEDRRNFDARPEVMATQEGKAQTKYREAANAGEQSIPIQEARRAEKAFKDNVPLAKALPEYWADENVARLQMSTDLQKQFAEQFANFDKTKYDKAVKGYYDTEVKDANGNHDFEATDVARQKYLAGLPADQQEWINQALQVARENKTPEHQSYLNYLDQKEAKGYFAGDLTPSQRNALDRANPALDVQQWYWRGNVQDGPGGKAKPGPSLNSLDGVKQALAMDPKRPVTYQDVPRAVNKDAKSLEYWNKTAARIDFYVQGGDAATQKAALEYLADNEKDWKSLSHDEQVSRAKSLVRDSLVKDPAYDAALIWWGVREKIPSQEVYDALTGIVNTYGPMYKKAK